MNGFQNHTLESGLRLIMVPMTNTKTITALILVGTGSKYETKEINGISHFLEHMIFKGTIKRPGTMDIAQELDSIGADYNAFTLKEHTGYYIKAGTQSTDLILEVISDIFLNSKFDANEIEKEKGVISEEINLYLDTPTRYINDLFEELLYGDQPAGWDIAGKKETISKFNRDDFVKYFETHYCANNTVIAIAGNIKPDLIHHKIEEYFKKTRQANKTTKISVLESQIEPQIRLHYKKTDQVHCSLGVRGYNMFDPKKEAILLLGIIMGGNMSSRLFSEVREKRGLAYYVSSGSEEYTDSGYFTTTTGVDIKRVKEALKVILEEYRKIRDEKVSEQELKKAKEFIRGKTAIGLEGSDDLASFYATQWLLKNELLTPEQKLDKIMSVTADQIQEIAQDIFKNEKLNLAVIGPFEKKDEFEELIKL